ncbi:zinc-ribbon domain-containing protein [Bifidobacterium sp. ESL0690]|uniref:zinc-ribbon domain-containing protein n=1 Tax=Bifidobacterium sp. ESL0690 TaxID=2983214 RepID=UPI0023F74B3C|nr:zinc-ribbon domain-containing protein [Bifidobacterium sp. ESL0690]WEV47539.1 zinc-ribbon domain-containing protein [Bifidobacterium sp. ESL0690]
MNCVHKKFLEKGLELIGEFQNTSKYVRCQCIECGIAADYIPKTVWKRELSPYERVACDACYLRGHKQQQPTVVSKDQQAKDYKRIQEKCKECSFNLVDVLYDGQRLYAIIVECLRCGRRLIEDSSIFQFGCPCMSKAGSATVKPRNQGKPLVSDSDSGLYEWWDFERNNIDEWKTAPRNSAIKQYWWKCPNCGHRFQTAPVYMPSCPECSRRTKEKIRKRYGKQQRWEINTRVSDIPQLSEAWNDESNPNSVTLDDSHNDKAAYRFQCPKGHQVTMSPSTYLHGCPVCKMLRTKAKGIGDRALAFVCPEISEQWNPEKNGNWNPGNVTADSKRNVWWKCGRCNYEWQQRVKDRFLHPMWLCPKCKTLVGSLAYFAPDLAKEWSPENPLTAWEITPTGATPFVPKWICSVNPHHQWQASTLSRWQGHSSCPECKETGKSAIELEYFAEARELFENVRSGVLLKNNSFSRGSAWRPDIICRINDQNIAIEYDGDYWHRTKVDTDTRKTQDLLDAGWIVFRLREHGLASLGNLGNKYKEITVYKEHPEIRKNLELVEAFVDSISGQNL